MSNADTIAALYDHEREQPLNGARRRRDAQDWGADDLFDGTPQRTDRFAQRTDRFARDRRPGALQHGRSGAPLRQRDVADWFADDDPRDAMASTADDRYADDRYADDFYADDCYADDRFADGHVDGRREHEERAADARRGPGVSTTAPTLELDLPIGAARPARRTVTVTGHPEATRRAERAVELHHRRPGRSLDDRIAHRPDHIAAYACGLGFLLILIAVLTASP